MAQTIPNQIKVLTDYVAESAEMIGRVSIGNADRLELIRKMHDDLAAIERLTVQECRACHWTWQEIGDALGTSRQNVHQRYA